MSSPPKALRFVAENVPGDLAAFGHWVPWRWEHRGGRWTKVPVGAASGLRASSTDPSTWAAFEEAVRYAR